ncbi:MAG: CDP-alcohol phosphatidyltransferase family protein [Candidatus Auribacterota bacterium]|nr:CDP-alcohol phosphatidyltransferase family protein [Candidatus Auribacterota bacterium]
MNLPNKITIGRLIAVPFILGLLLLYDRSGRIGYYITVLIIYSLCAVSDGVDGYLARSRNLQTQLGTLLDPLADKVLLDSLIILLACGIRGMFHIPVWFVLIVLCRDLILLTIALFLRKHWSRGVMKIKPNWWGKTSAVLLMTTVVLTLLQPCYQPLEIAIKITLYLTAVFTIIAGITYLIATFQGLRLLENSRS